MPLLSTIIPHLGDDSLLETTILSVLENQSPLDGEIIVVHDGSYSDPYDLGDELLLIEEPSGTPVQLLNAGLFAACAPVVGVLTGGAIVEDTSWLEAAHWLFSQEDSSVATLAVETYCGTKHSFGIAQQAITECRLLQRGQVDLLEVDTPAAPNLIGGLFDRRTMLALGGWNESLSLENAAVEMAFLMRQLDIHSELADVRIRYQQPRTRNQTPAAIKQLADIAVAYGLSGSGTGAAMTELLRGCLTGNISAAVAWATAIMGVRGTPQLQTRFQQAKTRYASLLKERELERMNSSISHRRAA